jgi:hypothetical protein
VPVHSVVLSEGDATLRRSNMHHTHRVSLYLWFRECSTSFAGTADVSDSLFLHGAAVGEYVAAEIFDDAAAEPRFSLACKDTVRRRAVH